MAPTRTHQARRTNTLCRDLRGHGKRALLSLMVASLLLLAACDASGGGSSASQPRTNPTATLPAKWHGGNPGGGVPTVTPPASLSPRPFPAFNDPRVAYIGPDSLLHVVTLDGQSDLAGTPIPLAGTLGDGIWAAGTSPDGKHLAYFEDVHVTTIDAASGIRSTTPTSEVTESAISWAPDQRYLALRGLGDVMCVNIANQTSFYTPQDTLASGKPPASEGPDGWLEATHVAGNAVPNTSGTPGTHGIPPTPVPGSPGTRSTLESLDITTNQVRPIATINAAYPFGNFSVLPGGQWTLFTNIEDQDQPFTPQVAFINNATGSVTALRHLASLLPPRGFDSIVWRPNSTQAIVATGFPQTQDVHYLLIDALQDTATPIALPGFPEEWSPDGSTLVVATGSQASNLDGIGWQGVGEVGAGPFTLTAVRIGMDGSTSSGVTLTTHAMNIPTLGFVHTA